MSNVTPQLVKELRDRTNVAMGKCKEALEEAHGNIETAIEILRKKGMASAVKKEGRETKEGVIAIAENDAAIAVIEVNAETDFATQNEMFKNFAQSLAEECLKTKPHSVEAFMEQKSHSQPQHTIAELRAELVQRIGENIQVKRLHIIPKHANHSYGIYSHMGGKIVCISVIEGASDVGGLARELGLHIAAEAPEYLSADQVPAAFIQKEVEIAKGQVPGNKPQEIVEKIVAGKVKASLDQICLVDQKYVRDSSMTVAAYVEAEGKKAHKTLKVVDFLRWQMGQ